MLIASALAALATATAAPLARVSPEELPALAPEGSLAGFRLAVERQIQRCAALPPEATWDFDGRVVSRRIWCQQTGTEFLRLARGARSFTELWREARTHFEWYRSTGSDGRGSVLYTGYYQPLLHGRREPGGAFTYPLYARPEDLDPSTPYLTRRQIDFEGALEGRGLEIAWVDRPVDGYFLHVQGSGLVQLEDRTILVNFAAANGHPFRSVGKIMKDEGVDPSYLNLQGMRRYFEERPEEYDRLMPMNPRYIFFREAVDGPYGSGGTILVPGHSIATDNSIFPLGSLALVSTRRSRIRDGRVDGSMRITRLVVNQDTGSAIRGPARVDLYWGPGEEAELIAGNLKYPGELYFAVVRQRPSR